MFIVDLYPTGGRRLWISETAHPSVAAMKSFWCIGARSFRCPEKELPLSGHNDWALATSFLDDIVYLGTENGRFYFAKGVGSVFNDGCDSDTAILERSEAFRLKTDCERITNQGIAGVLPEKILSHKTIPATGDDPPLHRSNWKTCPCMFVYSSSTRWRLSDLLFLAPNQRQSIFGRKSEQFDWFGDMLRVMVANIRQLREKSDMTNISLSNIFLDGSIDTVFVPDNDCSETNIAFILAEALRIPLSLPGLRRRLL